jgi:hypothetical protein
MSRAGGWHPGAYRLFTKFDILQGWRESVAILEATDNETKK